MKAIISSGKRKRAVAKITLKEGKGMIRINHKPIDTVEPEFLKLKLQEPLILAGNPKNISISIKVNGGGVVSQIEAARLGIARALVKWNNKLEETFLKYDRHLLVADVRRKEMRKPNRHGKARSKVQKSYRWC